MTIRLSAEHAEELETVADVEARPVSEVIRAAINRTYRQAKEGLRVPRRPERPN